MTVAIHRSLTVFIIRSFFLNELNCVIKYVSELLLTLVNRF